MSKYVHVTCDTVCGIGSTKQSRYLIFNYLIIIITIVLILIMCGSVV